MDIDKITDADTFIKEFPKDKKLILLCESGSQTYGFKSEGSDLDLRGVYVEDTNKMLGLSKSKDVISGFNIDKSVDWQIFELKKFLGLMVKSNYNILEWIYTPYKFINPYPEFEYLADKCLSRQIGNHVRGWAYSIYKMDWKEPKKCLYALRPLMSYITLIDTSQFHSDINILKNNFTYGLVTHIDTLISCHMDGERVPERVMVKNLKYYHELSETSKEIEAGCWLPMKADSKAMANQMLLNMRLYNKFTLD